MKKKILATSMLVMMFLLIGNCLFAQTQNEKPFSVKVTGKGEPILFIPGLTCSGTVWDETIAKYSKNYECHVLTLAGYAGQAPIEKPPYLDAYKNAIIQYIKDKKLDNVILVGHSIGGFLALRIATEMQQHLKKAIIVDALPFYAGLMNPNAKDGFDEDAAKKSFAQFEKMDYKAIKAGQLNTAKFLCADSTKWDMIATWGATSDRQTMAYSMYEMLGNDIRQKIADIKIPVLVMAAFAPVAQYPTFTKDYVLSSYKQQYEQCKSCVVKATDSSKHFIMYDSPAWYFNEIDTFIK
ncbi:alpha/beta fold hydrolase [Pedobacter duraquae]|uniref:Pimeloyl-ACP methyl ester carboxylesterase n=1 Tax=Pedobacter duraquae TaxID=425511 RepID=A0A4R6IGH7_9SPHI|nr:alpha/beta hydrolase [Pedobacter duraquae]TDO21262.1 pimeloyl-ACP methyl ester carboxylesterase [Pedobacter duraquae]